MDLKALAEANRRGLLSGEMKETFDEAQRRGLVPGGDSVVDFTQPKAQVRKQIQDLPKRQRKAAFKQWAQQRVSSERKKSADTTLGTLSDAARNLARGTPVGSFLDEGLAALRSGSVSGEAYDEAVALERARNAAVDKESTKLGSLPVIGDVTVGGLTKLAGAVASAPFTPVLRAAQGAAFLPRAAAYGTTGALYGGLYGAGEGDNVSNRVVNAAIGAGAGAGVGVGGAAIASTVGPAVQHVRNRFGRGAVPPELQNMHPQAVRRVSESVRQDGISPKRLRMAAVPNEQTGTVTALGDRGMIADLGHNPSALAAGIVKQQGSGSAIIHNAVRGRRAGAQTVLRNAADETLGAPVNTARAQQTAVKATRAAATPHYKDFYAGPKIPITKEFGQTLLAIEETTPAATRALAAMKRRKAPVNFDTGQNVNQYLDRLRRQLSSLSKKAYRSGDNELGSEYGSMAKSINDHIDSFVDTYAKARNAAGEGFQYTEGLAYGRGVLGKKINANQVEVDLEGMTPIGQMGAREGLRQDLRDVVVNSTTQYGEAPTAGLRQLIGTDAKRKVAMAAPAGRTRTGVSTITPIVTGRANPMPGQSAQVPARIAAPTMEPGQMARTVDQEAWFNRLYAKAIQGSKAAAEKNAQKLLPPQPGEVTGAELRGTSGIGLLADGTAKLFNLVRGGHLDKRNDRIVADMARMLVAQGADRRQIVEGLLKFGNYRGVSAQRREAINRVVEAVMQPAQVTAGRVGTQE